MCSEMLLPRYPGTSGPRDAAADPLQSSLGFFRTSTMQAISGGGDPATINCCGRMMVTILLTCA
jgi:hypothetical protein